MKQNPAVLLWQKLLLVLLLTVTIVSSFRGHSIKNTYYITPTPDTPCPGDPCHTLSQYAEQYHWNNFSSNTPLVFLPGDHTLNVTISMGSVSKYTVQHNQTSMKYLFYSHPSLTLLGSPSSLPEVTSRIICSWPAGFIFSGITELHISSLAFISCGHNDSAAVNFLSVQNVIISNCTFQNNINRLYSSNISNKQGGAVYVHNSTLTLTGNIFQNNFAQVGGALYANTNNTLTISKNVFQNNSADYNGGALHTFKNNTITLSENAFWNNSATWSGGALYLATNNAIRFSENIFQINSAGKGGALYSEKNNTLTLSENIFQNNSADYNGGALHIFTSSTLTLSENTFRSNFANLHGGALYANTNNTLTLSENTFEKNSANYGGALYAYTNNTLTLSESIFQNNSADYKGGALHTFTKNALTLSVNTFQKNSADYGGALYAYRKNALTLAENMFQNNSADYNGGALHTFGKNALTLSENTFRNNSAKLNGGGLYLHQNAILNLSLNTFNDNSASFGGALAIRRSIIKLTNNNFTGNIAQSYGGAIFCFSDSTLEVLRSHRLKNNTAQYGGGIAALESQVMLAGDLLIANNSARFGGGLYVDHSHVSGYANFTNNSANEDGGAVYSSGSKLYFKQHITFIRNSALNGGGLLLTEKSQLYLQPNTTIDFTNNFAGKKGGAIKVEKSNPLSYCVQTSCEFLLENGCFFQIETQTQYDIETVISEITELHNVRIYFENNTALEAGTALYGGSIDNCSLNFINPQHPQSNKLDFIYSCPNSGEIFDYITSSDQQSLDISSDPLYICPCEGSKIDCSVSSITRSVYPGGTIKVPITAYGQRNGPTPAVIHVTHKHEIKVADVENTQSIKNSCTFLTYTVQTSAIGTTQEMTLYAEGPCALRERTVSTLPTNAIKVYVSIRKCPPGFEILQFQSVCKCAQRLQRFTNKCKIDDGTIERSPELWVGYVPNNSSDGLILHPHCPFDYCISKKMYIAVDDSDQQCNNNRAGLLCGHCGQDFSLVLGTNRCLQCSNDYLWLIVAFAFAGVALVLLLFVLRLTVAVGAINGLLFYANVFAVNSATFLQPQNTNILIVFIAWLNLDLGIETCFYNGMDAYTKTWLQFAFPLYVWALLIAIIIISHYSIRISTILSNSTIEVLATLILLSYSKLLRTFIAVLSYTHLEYPNNLQIAVWYHDGNIRYLSSKHMPLFIAAVVCLVFLFLPYTVFLLFGQWLRKSGWRIFSWVNDYRVLPFLDAYHAPYSDKHRYWTGLMLLVRCILFLIFALNTLGDPNINLLCIACTTVMLHILHALSGNRIYKTWFLTILELSFNTNLCILAIATLYTRSSLAASNQTAVSFTSISIAFATFLGIVISHTVQQTKEAPRWWRRVFPLQRVSCDPFRLDSEPESLHQPNLPDLSGDSPTVTYLSLCEIARAKK